MGEYPSSEQLGAVVPGGALETQSPAGAKLAIRLWQAEREGVDAETSWQDGSPATCLLADLVAACQGNLTEDGQSMLHCTLPDPGTAVLTAKRIQWALEGFPAEKRTSAAMLIKLPEESSADDDERVLKETIPGQILITARLSGLVEGVPGFDLTSGSNGFSELLWSPYQPAVEIGEAAVGPFEASVPPSNVANVEASPPATGRAGRGRTREAAIPPALAGNGKNTASGRAEETGGPKTGQRDPVPSTGDRRRSAITAAAPAAVYETGLGSLTDDQEESPGFFKRRGVLIGAGVGVALVLAIVAVMLHPWSSGQPSSAAKTDTTQASIPVPPAANPEIPAAPGPGTATKLPKNDVPKNEAGKDRSKRAAKSANDGAKPDKPAVARVTTEPQIKGDCDLAPQAIPKMLDMAESNLHKGVYEAAGRQFRHVLSCEPSNARARDGLDRTRKAEAAAGISDQ